MYPTYLSLVLALLALSLPAQATPLLRPAKAAAQAGIARVDTCANVDQGTLSDGRTDYGTLTACLCHSTLPRFALLSPAARRASRALGPHTTGQLLQSLIASSPTARTCEYPSHALPSCSKEDVCAWVCEEGYDLCSGQCVPSGECAVLPAFSSPPAAPNRQEEEAPKDTHRVGLSDLLSTAQARCAPSYIACPAPPPPSQPPSFHQRRTFPFPPSLPPPSSPNSNSNPNSPPGPGSNPKAFLPTSLGHARRPAQPDPSFTCVNPLSDPTHCGGCSFSPSSPTSFGSFTGSDCSSIKGAASAVCEQGQCKVERCRHGWDLDDDQRGCTRRYVLSKGQVRLGKVGRP